MDGWFKIQTICQQDNFCPFEYQTSLVFKWLLYKTIFAFSTILFIFVQTLERNVSLSSGYLEELSVQYKKQIEDLQMSVRLASESLTMASKSRERDQVPGLI